MDKLVEEIVQEIKHVDNKFDLVACLEWALRKAQAYTPQAPQEIHEQFD